MSVILSSEIDDGGGYDACFRDCNKAEEPVLCTQPFTAKQHRIFPDRSTYNNSFTRNTITPTVGVISGGGVAVALFQLPRISENGSS